MKAVELRIRTIEEVRPGMVFMKGSETYGGVFEVIATDGGAVTCEHIHNKGRFISPANQFRSILRTSTELTAEQVADACRFLEFRKTNGGKISEGETNTKHEFNEAWICRDKAEQEAKAAAELEEFKADGWAVYDKIPGGYRVEQYGAKKPAGYVVIGTNVSRFRSAEEKKRNPKILALVKVEAVRAGA